jgi:hypothetical protein
MDEKLDDEQTIVRNRGTIFWTIYCRITANLWDVPVAKLQSFFASLDKEKVLAILVDVCQCNIPCCSLFTYRDLVETRAEALLSASVDHLASLLAAVNDEGRRLYRDSNHQTPVVYVIKLRRVCRQFYRSALSMSNHMCNKVRRVALGDTSPIQHTPPKYKRKVTKTQMCEAFWSDFFKSLSPSPVEGLLLWPGNRSRKLVYAIDFVAWFIRVHGGEQDLTVSTPSTPVRGYPN